MNRKVEKDTRADDAVPQARRPSRRTQADRSEETRRRTIDAAVACLWRDGYSTTTTLSVAAEAGLTRGAIHHHFPTKTDLMLAVADEVVRRTSTKRREMVVAHERGHPRFAALLESAWSTQQEPEAMTLLEILLASRGDRELAERLPALVEELEAFQIRDVIGITNDIGITDHASVEAMVTLHQAALRGLSLELLFAKDRTRVDAAFQLLRWYQEAFTARMLSPDG